MRAVIKDALLFVLDEAAANLDIEAENQLIYTLLNLEKLYSRLFT